MENFSKDPIKIPNFKSTKIACGYYHTVAISNEILYSWGKNEWGQLGIRTYQPKEFTPQKVKFLKNQQPGETFEQFPNFKIKDVTCGCYHTIAVSVTNKIYSFGRNSHG